MPQKQALSPTPWQYRVLAETCVHDDLGEFSTFGIATLNGDEFVHDVSADRETVAWMVGLFNQYQLSPIHLKEAVQELLP